MKRILVADKHSYMRKGIIQVLEESGQRFQFGEAEVFVEIMCKIEDEIWDLIILDFALDPSRGCSIVETIKQTRPKLPILVVSQHQEEQYALKVLDYGASSYLLKKNVPEHLAEATEAVLQGDNYISDKVAGLLALRATSSEKYQGGEKHRSLSYEELQIFKLLALGISISKIALQTNLNASNVLDYRHQILRKMQLQTNTQITVYAIENGLLD